MPTETTDLVMIMSLRDELSKDLKKATANLDKMKKQLGGTDKATKQSNTDWKAANSTLIGLSKTLLLAAGGVVTLAGAAKELISTSQDVAKVNTETTFTVSTLGTSAQKTYAQMKSSFGSIGAPFAATANQVNKAYGIMSKASGRATLSVQQLQDAFIVAKVTGVDYATAAQDVGEALRGNQESLRSLIGIYGYKGLSDVEAKATTLAQKSVTFWDRLAYGVRTIKEELSNPVKLAEFLFPPTQGLVNSDIGNKIAPHASGGLVTEPTAMIGLHTGKRGIMAEAGPEAIVPQRGRGGASSVVFNLYGTLIDKNALRSFAQQITPLLQQNNRRGGAASATYGG